MKKTAYQIITDFFGDGIEGFALNMLTVVSFLLEQKPHKKTFEAILKITCPDTSYLEFIQAISTQKEIYEKQHSKLSIQLARKIEVSGEVIESLKNSPSKWLFLALYWAYNFRDFSFNEIQEKYDHRIGDIALQFMLHSYQMKLIEKKQGIKPHSDKFYTNLAVRLVRIIETTATMSQANNSYLNRVYLNQKIKDIAANFLQILIENRFEKNLIDITKTPDGKSVMRYKNPYEGIELNIATTRMLKEGFLSEIDKTYREYQQLKHLMPVGHSRQQTKIIKKSTSKHAYEILADELIPVVLIDPANIVNDEEVIEVSNKILTRRDSGVESKGYLFIPSAFQQFQRNKAFSSTFAKNNLLLNDDYDIPVATNLSKFISKLSKNDENEIFYVSLFILSCTLGSKTEDILFLISKDKNSVIQIVDKNITIKIDENLFAKDSGPELLEENSMSLSFEIPHLMAMLITKVKNIYETVCLQEKQNRFRYMKFNKYIAMSAISTHNINFISKYFNDSDHEIILNAYEKYLKKNIKRFKRYIVVKPTQTHRYLPHYINNIGGDLRTAKLSTAVYSRNDRSKLAYTSTRQNATLHSQYIKQYWILLKLDHITSKLLNLPANIFTTTITNISTAKFTGSSRAAKVAETKKFFQTLYQNIQLIDNETDRFNLFSIYIRYAMSLLIGTREFANSADFSSYSSTQSLISINEKSQTLSMGIRYIPVCTVMKNLLSKYQNLLNEKNLKQNIYLYIDNNYKVYSARDVAQVLEAIPDLKNKKILQQYTLEVPTNTGRHIFTQKALDYMIKDTLINAFLGHYAKGEEQMGIWSSLNIQDYIETVTRLTSTIANTYGIKEIEW